MEPGRLHFPLHQRPCQASPQRPRWLARNSANYAVSLSLYVHFLVDFGSRKWWWLRFNAFVVAVAALVVVVMVVVVVAVAVALMVVVVIIDSLSQW